ncbi:zinc finger CCHC domain-containing protein 7-like isoform X1 [Babesia caballi]|uniref:Zinc finger CCHC domain-containing protein 7-like isoform X1 n=1 Tax=Babesia caballi TaxID=5871 RepID=A0AAV4LRU1_BABCB|nr:zinc finger CCHC domain-containing protein 7-like isoform X1 [Babesia caballi]
MNVHPKEQMEIALFSLDVEGEGFVPEEEEFADCAINVRDSQPIREPIAERLLTVDIPSATHIAPLTTIRRPLSEPEARLHRQTVLELRRFIYNSIVCEDFCASCQVVKAPRDAPGRLSEVSDISSSDSLVSIDGVEDLPPPSPSATSIQGGDDGPRKAPRLQNSSSLAHHGAARSAQPVAGAPLINPGVSMPRLAGLRCKVASADRSASYEAGGTASETVDATDEDAIKLELSVRRLSNIVTDIEHVQMCSSVPFPRLFRLSKENLSAGLISAGRRYFLAAGSETTLGELGSHKSFLAHFYRRKRSVCFFCGFSTCPRTLNCKKHCSSLRCSRCSFVHRWAKNRCRDQGDMVDYYLRTNDWRQRRDTPWMRVPKNLKTYLVCFYCCKPGDAGFKCRGVSCPRGAATLDYRCLEMLGKVDLDRLVRQKPQMFRHLRDRTFEFN